jgi:hypothetical protein
MLSGSKHPDNRRQGLPTVPLAVGMCQHPLPQGNPGSCHQCKVVRQLLPRTAAWACFEGKLTHVLGAAGSCLLGT